MNATNIPAAVLKAASRIETNGFRWVRIAPNGPDPEVVGYTVYLCKRLKTGLRLTQVEVDTEGNLILNR